MATRLIGINIVCGDPVLTERLLRSAQTILADLNAPASLRELAAAEAVRGQSRLTAVKGCGGC